MKLVNLFLACATVLGTGCIISTDDGDSTLTVDNQSDFIIDELYVVDHYDDDWGPNLIPEALYPHETIDIDVECGTYDALLVAEDGVECELDHLDLCYDASTWVITNDECPVFGAAPKATAADGAAPDALAKPAPAPAGADVATL
jgi:hypothetical protein